MLPATQNQVSTSTVSIFVGIDVSKDSLEVHVQTGSKSLRASNDASGIESVRALFEAPEAVLVVLEATGGYESELAGTLSVAGFHVVVVNPRQVRDFAKALGRSVKTDSVHAKVLSIFAVHAKVLALFAERVRPIPAPLSDESRGELEAILTRRLQLLDMLTTEENRLPHANLPKLQNDIAEHIKWLSKTLKDVEVELDWVLRSSPIWCEKQELLRSAPSVTGPPSSSSRLVLRAPSGGPRRRSVAPRLSAVPLPDPSIVRDLRVVQSEPAGLDVEIPRLPPLPSLPGSFFPQPLVVPADTLPPGYSDKKLSQHEDLRILVPKSSAPPRHDVPGLVRTTSSKGRLRAAVLLGIVAIVAMALRFLIGFK